jgi:cysteinyl-tRNA synthetase
MFRETLGDQIDIHGGGADLIFPHHENEIAQSESLSHAAPFARHWTHVGLVTLAGGDKMAHSAENFTTLASILDRYDALAVRFFLVATHYRSSLTFALEESSSGSLSVRGIEDARAAIGRLRRALGDEPLAADPAQDLDTPSVDAFTAAMDADFNTPDALAVIFDLAREINTRRAAGDEANRQRRTLVHLLDVLGLDIRDEAPTGQRDVDPYVELLLEVRRKLRDIKQWSLADEIRSRLGDLGVTVEDRPGGESSWRLT